MPNPLQLKAHLDDLRLAYAALLDAVAELEALGDEEDERNDALDGLALLLDELTVAKREVGELHAEVEAALFDRMGERRTVIPGRGQFERAYTAAKQRWESRRLLQMVVTSAVVNDAGERLVEEEAVERVIAALDAVLPVTPSMTWRKGGLDLVLGKRWRTMDLLDAEQGRKTVRRI